MEQAGIQEASIRPLALLFLVIMGIMTLKVQRRYAPIPLLVMTCYMPLGQMFIIGGLHFQFFRVILLLGMLRVVLRHEFADFVLTPLDKLFIVWAIVGVVFGTLAEFGWERFVNRAGDAFNAFAAYFLFRAWIRDLEDVIQTVRLMAMIIIPLAISMLVEKFTTRNVFAIFGGVPEITSMREGSLRCQGAFRHPILAGTYAATLFPLFVGLWFQPRVKRWIPIAGICASLFATVAASSSGALLATMAAVLGFSLWSMRCRMRVVRWSIVLAFVALAMVMKAPIWYLPAKISDLMGGTGWHRSYLIDQAIQHFNEWWLVGSAVTAHWAPGGSQVLGVDHNNMDITNNYIAEGLGGGVVKLGLFITMIVMSFKFVGRWTKTPEATIYSRRMFVWGLGICLLGHCVSFLSVSYFDQIVVMWYWLLAVMAMLCLLRERSWNMMPQDAVTEAGFGEPLGAEQG